MTSKTASPKTSGKKTAPGRNKAAAQAKTAPISQAPLQTALAKITPNHVRARKKRRHIVARVNVGWGHTVYLRGDGGSLSW